MKTTLILLISLVLFWNFHVQAQSFYALNQVQKIHIYFCFQNWDDQLNEAYLENRYIKADSIVINQRVYPNVSVKYKGNSSYNPAYPKKSIHIELNTSNKNQHHQGFTDIKLHNSISDPSMIREVLSYWILKDYMDCPKSNFADVFINDQHLGLFTNTESVNKRFCIEHYSWNGGVRVKGNVNRNSFSELRTGPDLHFVDLDSSSYIPNYILKSKKGWSTFINFLYTLNKKSSQIDSVLDVDRVLWMLAFNNILLNLDSYSGVFRQNYYLTEDNNHRFVPTVWDLNMSWGGFPIDSDPNLDLLYNSTSQRHPLIAQLLEVDEYKEQYIAHCKTIYNEVLVNENYLNQAKVLIKTISPYVLRDTNKFFTNHEFLMSLDSSITSLLPTPSLVPGIHEIMSLRKNYLKDYNLFKVKGPEIIQTRVTMNKKKEDSRLVFHLKGSEINGVQLFYRFDIKNKFSSVEMKLKKNKFINRRNKQIFNASINQVKGPIHYYFILSNEKTVLFHPPRAAHEYLIYGNQNTSTQ